jgi:segregation and condensation protein B
MTELMQKIQGILFWKAEPVSFKVLASLCEVTVDEARDTLYTLQTTLEEAAHGLQVITEGETALLTTHPTLAPLIEKEQKDEATKDLSKAALETLSLILYRGPLMRSEIDYVRGVNSQFILRSLLVRGLITKTQKQGDERIFTYAPSVELLAHLGVTDKKSLPDFQKVNDDIEAFMQQAEEEDTGGTHATDKEKESEGETDSEETTA